MKKYRNLAIAVIAESVILLFVIAAVIFVVINLRPIAFNISGGTPAEGWRWRENYYVDAGVFSNEMNTRLDMDNMEITFSTPIDPLQVKAETEEAMTLQFDKTAEEIRREHEEAIAALEETIKDLEAQVATLEESALGNTRPASGGSGSSNGNNQSSPTTGGGRAGAQQAPESQTPAAPPPAQQAATPTPSVDANACIAEARAYALSLGMTEDTSISIGNSGYLNPPDITVLTQANVIDSLKYCLNQYLSYSPDDPSLVHFNIVQSGNLIYALYQ